MVVMKLSNIPVIVFNICICAIILTCIMPTAQAQESETDESDVLVMSTDSSSVHFISGQTKEILVFIKNKSNLSVNVSAHLTGAERGSIDEWGITFHEEKVNYFEANETLTIAIIVNSPIHITGESTTSIYPKAEVIGDDGEGQSRVSLMIVLEYKGEVAIVSNFFLDNMIFIGISSIVVVSVIIYVHNHSRFKP